MRKFQVSVKFTIDEHFMGLIPRHREVINTLITTGVIDQYAISAQLDRGWITMTVRHERDIYMHLEKSPIYKYLDIEVDEIMIFDGKVFRFPAMQLN
jgi:hypothetical protein